MTRTLQLTIECDLNKVMAYYNLSDAEWDSLSESTQDKLIALAYPKIIKEAM